MATSFNHMNNYVQASQEYFQQMQKTGNDLYKNFQTVTTQSIKETNEYFQKVSKQPYSSQNIQHTNDLMKQLFDDTLKVTNDNASKIFDLFQSAISMMANQVAQVQNEVKKASEGK